jgi:hypothetical protein
MDTRETGGLDRLDTTIREAAAPVPLRALDVLRRSRAALGLEPLTAPALLFVPLGLLMGPSGLGLLTPAVIGRLDSVIALALAALGIFIGMALELRSDLDRRLLVVASAEALTTFVTVFVTTLFLLRQWGLPLDASAALVAAVLATAACVSSAGASEASDALWHRTATRIADLDDGIAVAGGAIAVAAVHGETAQAVLATVLFTVIVGLLAGCAGWLLFDRARSEAERAVFVLGAIALVGGAAEYLRSSPLLAGALAGAVWRRTPGPADRIIRTDVGRFQHPLVILLLVAAGALVTPTRVALWLLAPVVVFRLSGKIAGGWIAARLIPGGNPAALTAYLLPPGLLGVAIALNVVQVSASPAATAILSAVTLGTLASELLALIVLPAAAE